MSRGLTRCSRERGWVIRLAAQSKLGYYPINPEALEYALRLIQPPETPEFTTLLDPCCGAGAALAQIAAHLKIPAANVYGVELDEGRAAESAMANPGATILGPADYLSASISAHSVSMIYCNPPFDDEMGGGQRAEAHFFYRVALHLKPGGLLLMVLPQKTWHQNLGLRESMDSYFKDGKDFAFPSRFRKYREVFVFGVRRRQVIPTDSLDASNAPFSGPAYNRYNPIYRDIDAEGGFQARYQPPTAPGPKRFAKTDYTEAELIKAIDASRLNALLDDPKPAPRIRPPLALGNGHLALLLSSGKLDGLVCPPDEPPHVIKGTVRKEQYESDCERNATESGSITEKKVISERVVRVIRILDRRGQFKEMQG